MSEVAVITGGGSGLGKALGRLFAASGAKVILLDRSEAAGQSAAEETGASFIACDVTDRESWASAARQIADRFGAPTHLALNAGVMTRPPSAPLSDDVFDWIAKGGYKQVMAVNVDGVVFGLEAILPLMKNGGAVTVTASAAAISPLPFDPFYAASKHALIGLVRSLEPALGQRAIRINAFCPGGIATAITPDALKDPSTAARHMQPEEAADALMETFRQTGSGNIFSKLLPGAPMTNYIPAPIDLNMRAAGSAQ